MQKPRWREVWIWRVGTRGAGIGVLPRSSRGPRCRPTYFTAGAALGPMLSGDRPCGQGHVAGSSIRSTGCFQILCGQGRQVRA